MTGSMAQRIPSFALFTIPPKLILLKSRLVIVVYKNVLVGTSFTNSYSSASIKAHDLVSGRKSRHSIKAIITIRPLANRMKRKSPSASIKDAARADTMPIAKYPALSLSPIAVPLSFLPTISIFMITVVDQVIPWLKPSAIFAPTAIQEVFIVSNK